MYQHNKPSGQRRRRYYSDRSPRRFEGRPARGETTQGFLTLGCNSFKTCTYKCVIAFIEAIVAIGVGIGAGIAFGVAIYRGMPVSTILALIISATVGVLTILLLMWLRYKKYHAMPRHVNQPRACSSYAGDEEEKSKEG